MGGGAGRGGRYNAALISRLSSMIAAAPRVTGGGCQGSGGAKDIGGRGGERGWRGRYLIGEEASSGKESRHHRGRRGRATAGEGRGRSQCEKSHQRGRRNHHGRKGSRISPNVRRFVCYGGPFPGGYR
jgi:hypothetical protein